MIARDTVQHLQFHRTTLIGLIIGFIMVVGVAIATFITVRDFMQSSAWVSHTTEVINHLGRLENELAQLRYISAFAPDQSKKSKSAETERILEEDKIIRRLTADNASQQSRLDRLEPEIAHFFEILATLTDSAVLPEKIPFVSRQPLYDSVQKLSDAL